jgi:hypothetical protein
MTTAELSRIILAMKKRSASLPREDVCAFISYGRASVIAFLRAP